MALAVCISAGAVWTAHAGELSLEIGSPVATRDFRAKAAVFAVRSKGCADLASFKLSGAAEGVVSGDRQTVPLKRILAMPTAGVFAVVREWPLEGAWVVSLVAECGEATAGALVPVGERTFVRETAKFFPRAATSEEIEAGLRGQSRSVTVP
jgi:hypothetical protein